MANTDHCFLSLSLLLLVLTTATTATTAPAPATHRRLHQTLPTRLDDDDDTSRGPPALLPAVQSCWRAILATESCDDDVVRLLATHQVRVISKACCSVLEKVGDKCVAAAFSSFPFNPTYPDLVKNACGLLTA